MPGFNRHLLLNTINSATHYSAMLPRKPLAMRHHKHHAAEAK